MSGHGYVSPEVIRFALADSIAFLKADDWDRVSARSGLFLSRRFLEQLERNLPDNLATHYALAYSRGRPVAAIVRRASTFASQISPPDSLLMRDADSGIPWRRPRNAPSHALESECCCLTSSSRGPDSMKRSRRRSRRNSGPRWRRACGAGGTVS